jgi:hypothetical protein
MWQQPKLLVPYMIRRLAAYLDADEHLYFVNVTTGGYGITVKPDTVSLAYLTGLLNSRLLHYVFKELSSNFSGNYFPANKQIIERLPIATVSRHETRYKLVEEIEHWVPQAQIAHRRLAATLTDRERAQLENSTQAIDRQIDQRVYELYGLSESQIKCVDATYLSSP